MAVMACLSDTSCSSLTSTACGSPCSEARYTFAAGAGVAVAKLASATSDSASGVNVTAEEELEPVGATYPCEAEDNEEGT